MAYSEGKVNYLNSKEEIDMKKFEHVDTKTAVIYSVIVAVVGSIVTGGIMFFRKKKSSEGI